MLFKNANIFVDGRFQHGSFYVENGKFSGLLPTVPAEDGVDLENQYVIPGLIDVHNHGNSGADFPTASMTVLPKWRAILRKTA